MTKRVTILGSTGSIGESTLDLVRRAAPGAIQVVALTANSNAEKLADQAVEFGAEFVALADEKNAALLRATLKDTQTEIGIGPAALIHHRRGRVGTNSGGCGSRHPYWPC